MDSNIVKLTVSFELTDKEALALAQFCKRTTHQDCADRAVSEDEAYLMMDGINTLMRGLSEAGIAPR